MIGNAIPCLRVRENSRSKAKLNHLKALGNVKECLAEINPKCIKNDLLNVMLLIWLM